MKTNSDIVREILFEAYEEIVGRGLTSQLENIQLVEIIKMFVDHTIDERKINPDEKYDYINKEYIGYRWKEIK